MERKYAKYMRYGKQVIDETGTVYDLIEDLTVSSDEAKAVKEEKSNRWNLLCVWIQNYEKDKRFRDRFTEDIEKCRQEKESYEEYLKIEDIQPANIIRFVDVGYILKFWVKDLEEVIVNGIKARVYYIDNYHFGFVPDDKNKLVWWGVYHIHEFAEFCVKNNIKVEPVERQ